MKDEACSGLPDARVSYDQEKVNHVIEDVIRGNLTIAQGARDIGCNDGYLGRRTWGTAKRRVSARDGKCVRCGSEGTDVHHRKPRGQGGSYDPLTAFGFANLVFLCRKCHDHVHRHVQDSYNAGYLVHSWDDPENIFVGTKSGLLTLRADGSKDLQGSYESYF
jgi:5-methylcytosine-specific restriction enzyme A